MGEGSELNLICQKLLTCEHIKSINQSIVCCGKYFYAKCMSDDCQLFPAGASTFPSRCDICVEEICHMMF